MVSGLLRRRGDTLIRELWDRHMDSRRALSAALSVVAGGLGVLALAVTPGFVVAGGADPGGYAKFAPMIGGAFGMAVRGYAFHRKPGTRNGLRWALAQGGLMALLFLGAFAAAAAINPIVSSNPALGGDAWLGLLATALVLGAASGVLWEREHHRRRTAAVMLLAVCLIILGLVGLRAGGLGILIGTPLLAVGVFGLVAATVQGAADLVQGAANSSA